eukprot:238922-Chlamydomonas_euryale.AAC.1
MRARMRCASITEWLSSRVCAAGAASIGVGTGAARQGQQALAWALGDAAAPFLGVDRCACLDTFNGAQHAMAHRSSSQNIAPQMPGLHYAKSPDAPCTHRRTLS